MPLAEQKRFDAKQFDQTFPKFDAWCESMEGRRDEEERSAEEGRDINTQIKGGETLKKQLAVIIGAILAISAVSVMPYCLAGAAISGGWVFYGNDGGYLHGLANRSFT